MQGIRSREGRFLYLATGISQYTREKQSQVVHVIQLLMTVLRDGIWRKYQRSGWALYPKFFYVDLTAGPGMYESGAPGSPLIALRCARWVGIPIRAFFCEKSRDSVASLRHIFNGEPDCEVLPGDNRTHIEYLQKALRAATVEARDGWHGGTVFGLVYWDSNGGETPPGRDIRLLTSVPKAKLDVLLHVNAASIKRVHGVGLRQEMDLIQDIQDIGKQYWMVREPVGQWQWCFALGTDWRDFPKMTSRGFYDWDSKEGQEILNRVYYTRAELKELRA